jgi:hypothetical protein
MSTVLDGELRIQETATVLEAAGGAVDDQGHVLIHLIRPCVGKGRGRHVYEADMLKRHAESGHFKDWPMFVDHESPAARRAAGGLPRSFRDLGGRVVETSWDDSVPAGDGFGQGAVLAKVLPVPWIQEMIRHDPKLAAVSVNTFATGVKPTTRGGRPAYIVEGFDPEGSVDWVTRAGAGGKVVQLLEAAYEGGHDMHDDELKRVMEAMPDDRLAELLKDKRPAVAETLLTTADHGEEDDVKPEELREAVQTELRSDETQTIIQEAVTKAVSNSDAIQEAVTESLREVLPGAIGKAAEVIEEQAKGAATKAVRMGGLRDKAETAVEEAKRKGLPERFGQEVLERIGTPDLEDKTDDDGTVTESAEQQFDALLAAELKRATELVEAARPAPASKRRRRTAVTENGAGGEGTQPDDAAAITEAEEDEEDNAPYRESLQEAGVDFHAAYGVPKPKDKETDKGREPVAEAATA